MPTNGSTKFLSIPGRGDPAGRELGFPVHRKRGFIKGNEEHQLKNTGDEPFIFVCVIPSGRRRFKTGYWIPEILLIQHLFIQYQYLFYPASGIQ